MLRINPKMKKKKCLANECMCHDCTNKCRKNLYYVGDGIWCCSYYTSVNYDKNCPNKAKGNKHE